MYVSAASDFSDATPGLRFDFDSSRFADIFQQRIFHDGQTLFREGDKSNCVYQIVEGVVRTSKLLVNGRRQILAFGYPGDLVGLSHDCRYHNDCEAIGEVKVKVLRTNACSACFDDDQETAQQLMRLAASEVCNMQDHFLMLGRKSAAEKMASFLLTVAHRAGRKDEKGIVLDLPMCRSDIADFLGLTIETVSRTLTKLRKERMIHLPDPHSVRITSIEKLRNLADRQD